MVTPGLFFLPEDQEEMEGLFESSAMCETLVMSVLGMRRSATNCAPSSRTCRSGVASALVGPGCCPERDWRVRGSRRHPEGGAPQRGHASMGCEARAGGHVWLKEHLSWGGEWRLGSRCSHSATGEVAEPQGTVDIIPGGRKTLKLYWAGEHAKQGGHLLISGKGGKNTLFDCVCIEENSKFLIRGCQEKMLWGNLVSR